MRLTSFPDHDLCVLMRMPCTLDREFTTAGLAATGLLENRRGGGGGAMLEAGQALVECFSADASACTATPQSPLTARLAQAKVAFVADLNRSNLADCVYRPDNA